MSIELKKRIKKHVGDLKSAQDIFDLFRLLNYPENVFFDATYTRDSGDFGFKKEDNERIKKIYSILSFEDSLPVFLLETSTLTPSFIRSVTNKFDSQYMRFLLIFTLSDNYSEVIFVLPNRERVELGKYKLKITKLNVNKEDIVDKNVHYTVIETLSKIKYEDEPNWRFVWKKWAEALNVEKVTEAFFEDYKKIFFNLRDKIREQNIPQKDSHEFTLQFLNRIMFIYFVSKKGWLKYPKFMSWMWGSYKKLNNYGSNEFYEQWLNQIFFKAFNNRSNEISELPTEVKEVISSFPYLNGGLFSENKYDLKGVKINDKLFQRIYDFFEKYNFTIREDLPFESEVAVDPQMIGYVYESLANVADEIYDRKDMGIFYTPRVEVDFMCRRSLVEYLSKNLPDIPKENLVHFVFDLPEDKWKTEEYFAKEKFWYDIESVCDNLSVVDPACGSGAFLVGMLNVLDELYKVIYKYTERDFTDFERKYRIIQYSIYGVDVMPWAIHAAELRLWLQLIIETELKGEELRKAPLLPNLNLNLRIGDSLVQEVGGVSFNIRTNNVDPIIRKKLDELKNEKRLYYENSRTARFKELGEFKKEEIRLFEDIINHRITKITEKINFLQRDVKQKQVTLGIEASVKLKLSDKKRDNTKTEIKELEGEINNLLKIKEVLKDPEKKPFVWDIDFAEIFGNKNGFDIVIGNPPYVRQEMISPPNKIKSKVTSEDKRKYKDKLLESVLGKFPVINKIDKRSDYYIYFYFHGIGLLNENGTFCFITSNSWLDVGYGKNLQEFLLNYVPITAIYDNPKRSFAHADVNTIISLFGAPSFKKLLSGEMREKANEDSKMLNYTAKFVMFKKPFESVVNAKNLIEIEKIETSKGQEIIELVNNVVVTPDYRVFPVFQEDLLEDGWKYPKSYKKSRGRFHSGTYNGNKLGGKFLRAPQVFYEILEKGRNKLLKLEELADLSPGCYSGINDFFYLDSKILKNHDIEEKYMKQLIRSSRIVKHLKIEETENNYVLAIESIPKSELNNKVKSYVDWGEKQVTRKRQKTSAGILWPNVATVKSRKYWYSIPEKNLTPTNLFMQYVSNDRFYCPYSEKPLVSDRCFHRIFPKSHVEYKILSASLNSTLQMFFVMLFGRSNLGQGALKFETTDAKQILTLDISKIDSENKEKMLISLEKLARRKPLSVFEECGLNPLKPFEEQEPQPLPDRAELDTIIFDELGLSDQERKEVYWGVCELVKLRLDKAKSLR